MRKYIYLAFISILCFILGFLSFSYIENFALESFKSYNLSFSQMNTQFMHTLEFAIICGISPIVTNIIWKETKTEKSNSKIISVILLLLIIVTFVAIRFSLLKSELDSQKTLGFSTLITMEDLKFPRNILFGEILGLTIVYVFLKITKSKEQNAYR
ncbi:hypothetical protein [Flavobacterium aestuarii]|uniref:hypothetical protein n=1 Tax=Flavobacterium aestuarii TaxID=3149227 RepID=UPI0032B5376E